MLAFDLRPADDEIPPVGAPCPCCRASMRLIDATCGECGTVACEYCEKVAVVGAACCEACAPKYEVHVDSCTVYQSRNLRRAWEAQRWYDERYPQLGASLLNTRRCDMAHDGLTDREESLLNDWDSASAPVHLCLMRVGF